MNKKTNTVAAILTIALVLGAWGCSATSDSDSASKASVSTSAPKAPVSETSSGDAVACQAAMDASYDYVNELDEKGMQSTAYLHYASALDAAARGASPALATALHTMAQQIRNGTNAGVDKASSKVRSLCP